MTNPYQAPTSEVSVASELNYAGFWIRTAAMIVDTLLLVLMILPLMYLIYGTGYFQAEMGQNGEVMMPDMGNPLLAILINYVLPIVVIIAFWVYKAATPGKMLFGLKIVDAETGGKVSVGRYILRYIGYFLSSIVLGLGYLWVIWDARKQGWHDKISRTVVVRNAKKAK